MSLAEDLATAGLSHIGVHNLSPGMVLTDLLLKVGAQSCAVDDVCFAGCVRLPHAELRATSHSRLTCHPCAQDSTPTARRFFNALAEEPETAAAELVPRIRNIRVRTRVRVPIMVCMPAAPAANFMHHLQEDERSPNAAVSLVLTKLVADNGGWVWRRAQQPALTS